MPGMDPYAQMMQNRANNYYRNLEQNVQQNNQYNGGMTGYATTPPSPPPIIYGKFVANEMDVKPNDVPMDGKIAAFPQQDLSCVYLKSWNSRGTIDSVKYIPEVSTVPGSEEPTYDLRGEIEDIKATLARLEQSVNQRKQYNNFKQNKQSVKTEQVEERRPKNEFTTNSNEHHFSESADCE